MKILLILAVATLIVTVSSFAGSEDRFIKKYAMMKIYESCFGPEVVKQIRKEMKMACAKCASYEAPTSTIPPPTEEPPQGDSHPPQGNSVYPNQQPPVDIEKLHQAILAYRPGSMPPPSFRPYTGSPAAFYNPVAFGGPNMQNPAFSFFYPGYQPYSNYGAFPMVGQPFYGNRMSRDMDIKGQLEVLTSKMSGKVRNVTCVMQELGYLDENLEPNYNKISERIGNLPVSEELRRDMQDGVSFCQQFSQCVPEVKKDKSPLSRELIRPMFFFKCYKHKKLEACIMKDVREKYAGVTDEDFDSEMEIRRGRAMNMPESERQSEELAASVFEFLYASESGFEIDGIL